MIQTNVVSLSAYCVRACKIKHFTEREFSGFFFVGGGGEFCVFKTGIPGGPALDRAMFLVSLGQISWKWWVYIHHECVEGSRLRARIWPKYSAITWWKIEWKLVLITDSLIGSRMLSKDDLEQRKWPLFRVCLPNSGAWGPYVGLTVVEDTGRPTV